MKWFRKNKRGQAEESVKTMLDDEQRAARDRAQDPFFTDIFTNHNVGRDEQKALYYIDEAYQKAKDSAKNESDLLLLFLEELANQKKKYKELYYDQEGYGVGTFNEIEQNVRRIARDKGIAKKFSDG